MAWWVSAFPRKPPDYRVTIREILAERNSEQLRPKDELDRTTHLARYLRAGE